MCPSKMMLPGDVGGGSLAATSYSQVATALSVPWINSGVFERTLKSCRQSRRIAPKSRLRNSKRLGSGFVGGARYSSQNWRRIVFPASILSPKSQRECTGRHMLACGKNAGDTRDFPLQWPMPAFVACNPEFKNSQQISIRAGWGRGTGVLYERLSATRQS